MRSSDWSSDVCSSDLPGERAGDGQRPSTGVGGRGRALIRHRRPRRACKVSGVRTFLQEFPGQRAPVSRRVRERGLPAQLTVPQRRRSPPVPARSEEHTSELQSLMRISYAVFCLKKKKKKMKQQPNNNNSRTRQQTE